MFESKVASAAAVAAVAVLASSGAAQAQTVQDRNAGAGVRVGGFILLPAVDIGAEHSDNVFAQSVNEQSDTLLWINPRADLVSNWSVHSLALNAELLSRRYNEFEAQNTTDWTLGANGVLEITRRARVRGAASYTSGSEQIADNPNIGLREALEFTEWQYRAGGDVGFNRLELNFEAGVNEIDFDDGVLNNGSAIDQDSRDRRTVTALVGARYEVSPLTRVFVTASTNQREFDTTGLVNRDSEGVEVIAGVAFEASSLILGQFGVGYFDQSFDNRGTGDESGVSVRGALDWMPTPLISVGLTAERGVRDTGLIDAVSSIATGVTTTVDYEWRRNVILSADAGYSNNDFVGLDREDVAWSFGLGASYIINRTASVVTRFNRTDQDSSGSALGRDYEENVVSLSLRLQR